MDACTRLKVWEKVQLPSNKKLIKTRWIFCKKHNPDGTVRYKARLVAKGYMQILGDDFDMTFSPVARQTSIRTIYAISAKHNLQLHQMDVNNAFLNAELDQSSDIYIETPEGYNGLSKEECLRLHKALYGLKQAPREWNVTINNYLTEKGFTRLSSDNCIYVRGDINKGTYTIISIYVDDIMIAGQNIKEINKIKGELKSKWKMKDLGPVNLLLGSQVKQTSTSISLKQSYFIEDMLHKYQQYLITGKPKTVPMMPEVNLCTSMSPTTDNETSAMQQLP